MTKQTIIRDVFHEGTQRVRVKNTTNEKIPPYACMAIVRIKREFEPQNRIVYQVRKPNQEDEYMQDMGRLVINLDSPISPQGYGYGTRSFPCVVLRDSTDTLPRTSPQLPIQMGPKQDCWGMFYGGAVVRTLALNPNIVDDSADNPSAAAIVTPLVEVNTNHAVFRVIGAAVPASGKNTSGQGGSIRTGIVRLTATESGSEPTTTTVRMRVHHYGDEIRINSVGFASKIADKWWVTSFYC